MSQTDRQAVEEAIMEGERLRLAARWTDAIRAYDRALAIDPSNPVAQSGRTAAASRIDRGSSMDEVAAQVSLLSQAAIQEFDASCTQAREAMARFEFAHAKGLVLHAKAVLDSREQYLPVSAYEERSARAAALLNEIDEAQELHAHFGG